MAATETARSEAQEEQDLARLRKLVEESRVEEARRLAPELAARWPNSTEIQRLARVLEPPKIIPNPPGLRGRSFKRDHEWLREHSREYPGCWIAIFEDRLIAADPDLQRVMEAVRTEFGTTGELPFLHREPAEPT